MAAAIARGLAVAHAKGIVHRDLKPENVMLTRDGRVKILDFGIAKLRASDDASATDEKDGHTDPGMIVGSAGYMAPEQIRGLGTDGRADVFALGAMLFELLTGRGAFDRESRADTLHAGLHDDPPLSSSTTGEWPSTLVRIVQRCLEKDPEARFQSAADLAFALETAMGTTPASALVDRPMVRPSFVYLATAVVLFLATAGGVLMVWRASRVPAATKELARFALPLPPHIRFPGVPAISPDGTTIVYAAYEGPVETQRLLVRRTNQLATVALPGTEGGTSPFFSPDGQSIAFWADYKLKRTSLDPTDSPVVVCAAELFLGGTWTRDGTIVFGSINRGLQQVAADGGAPQPLTIVDAHRPEIDHHAPETLPGGRALLVTIHEGERRFRIDVVTPATGARRTVVENGFDARYVPTGHLVYGAGSALFAAPFDLARLELSGPPVQLLDGVAMDEREGDGHYSLSDTGTLVFLPLPPQPKRTLVWVDCSGGTTPLPIEPRTFWTPRLSPDGQQFAVVVQEGGTRQIWIHRFDSGTSSRVTSDGSNWAPVWSSDGSQLMYLSERNGHSQIVRQPVDGNAATEVLLESETEELVPGALSADGRTLTYVSRLPSGNAELRTLDMVGRRAETLHTVTPRVGLPALSPDGRWLGFTGWSSTRPSIFIRPVAGGGQLRLLMEAAGYTVWSRAGDRVFFRSRRGTVDGSADGIFELPFDPIRGVATGPEKELFRKSFTDALGVPGFDVSADGRFLMVLADQRESLVRELNVLLHVDDELRRRMR